MTAHGHGLAVDHLLFTVPDLQGGIDLVAELLGVRPTLGGRHPDLGTANALVALGPSSYFEVIAPDPDVDRDEPLNFLGTDFNSPKLSTWVAKADLSDGAATLPEVFGSVGSGRRANPDGEVLTWLFSDPFQQRFDGIVPFLIDWQGTRHPATALEQRCRLVELRLEHPTAFEAEASLDGFGGGITVTQGAFARVTAVIESPNGLVEVA